MAKRLITDEEIEGVITLVNQRKTLDAKKMLRELPEEKLLEDIKRIVRDNGRSNLIGIEKLQEVIKEHDSI